MHRCLLQWYIVVKSFQIVKLDTKCNKMINNNPIVFRYFDYVTFIHSHNFSIETACPFLLVLKVPIAFPNYSNGLHIVVYNTQMPNPTKAFEYPSLSGTWIQDTITRGI